MKSNWDNPIRSPEKQRAEHWDNMSGGFEDFSPQTAEQNPIIGFLRDKGMLPGKEMRVLDIGCAVGVYSLYFALRCREVVGTDISPVMISRAKSKAEELGIKNTRFIRTDWDNFSLDEVGGEKSFDFVFANLTPAISSRDNLEKYLRAARGLCFLGGSAGGSRLLGDRIYRLFDIPIYNQGNDSSVSCAFSQLWDRGIRPELSYLPNVYSTDRSVEKALEHYRRSIASSLRVHRSREFTPEDDKRLAEFIYENSENGIVHEEFHTNAAILTWDMRDL